MTTDELYDKLWAIADAYHTAVTQLEAQRDTEIRAANDRYRTSVEAKRIEWGERQDMLMKKYEAGEPWSPSSTSADAQPFRRVFVDGRTHTIKVGEQYQRRDARGLPAHVADFKYDDRIQGEWVVFDADGFGAVVLKPEDFVKRYEVPAELRPTTAHITPGPVS
ncbi:hypothetical protein [Singulisphaera sp. PoT]|uniref:hypothetical protein n=1 Tax=Singulisphaera sp. PoT TaxID=3411797 RepID=UPI003BF46C64